jgi:4-amino-4-deoxy-L-arabinose transferase-like glycosyltransferase
MRRRTDAPWIGPWLLLMAAAAYWLWVGLTQRSVVEDDGISILAADGILRHGYPLLPSGYLYHRAYLPNYLLAASIAAFGMNDLGILIPSLLLALAGLCLVYRFAADAWDHPAAGFLAMIWLVAQQRQTFYATSARMYMSLQFFSLLACWAAWRGYVKGERPFRWVAALAAAGAIFSHQQGGALLIIIPAAVLIARRMQGRTSAPLNRAGAIATLAGLWAAFYAATIYRPPGAMHVLAVRSGMNTKHTEFNLDLWAWLKHAAMLEATVPFGALLFPLVVWTVWRAIRRPRDAASPGIAYLGTVVMLGSLAVAAATRDPEARFWMYIVPPYVLLLSVSLLAFQDWWSSPQARKRIGGISSRRAAALGLGGWVAVLLAGMGLAGGWARYPRLVTAAYGQPCLESRCSPAVESQYERLRRVVLPEDAVISSNPWVTYYYLGRLDGFAKERRRGNGGFEPFPIATDEYFGVPLLDTAAEVKALARSSRRVWILADYKFGRYSSPEVQRAVKRAFDAYPMEGPCAVYVNRPEPADSWRARKRTSGTAR